MYANVSCKDGSGVQGGGVGGQSNYTATEPGEDAASLGFYRLCHIKDLKHHRDKPVKM